VSQGVADPPARLWGGRFGGGPAPELDRLNRSLPVDRRLWREDVTGSRAWVSALGRAGVLTAEESATLEAGLIAVADELATWTEAEWADAPDEDIHSLVERLLTEEVGAVAGKLHTGRSRNDQVATDGRLWALSAAGSLSDELAALEAVLADRAEGHVETLMPAYTHLQRAQPVSVGHWLLSHAWPLERDRDRLADARRRASVLPLGSGAVTGCPFPVDRELLRDSLGFDEVSPNSLDAVGDRDWAAELLFAMTLAAVHLSRLAEDLVIFGSAEFGFVRFADAYSTGSSLMPQKRNPDGLELARAGAGRILGELVGLVTVLKGLPGGYGKDLQEDKGALFRAHDHLMALLPAVRGTVATLEIDAARCAAALDDGMLATDLADALVEAGTPFRQAHEEVGRVVRAAEDAGVSISRLDPEAVRAASPAIAALDLERCFDHAAATARRGGEGGTAPDAVRTQLASLRARLVP
jgi:argininosuccinate lyase